MLRVVRRLFSLHISQIVFLLHPQVYEQHRSFFAFHILSGNVIFQLEKSIPGYFSLLMPKMSNYTHLPRIHYNSILLQLLTFMRGRYIFRSHEHHSYPERSLTCHKQYLTAIIRDHIAILYFLSMWFLVKNFSFSPILFCSTNDLRPVSFYIAVTLNRFMIAVVWQLE